MARRATLIDSLRALNSNCLIVDAGDFSLNAGTIGPPTSDFLFKMMGRLGYDAVAFGERELKFGHGHFTEPASGPMPVVMTNITHRVDGQRMPAAERFLIRDVGNVRIGIFSLLDPEMLKHVGDYVPSYSFEDPIEAAQMTLEEFDKLNVDVSVLLVQLDRSLADSVLKRFPEIDVAVIGHRKAFKRVKDEHHRAVVVNPERRGKKLAQVNLVIDPLGNVVEHELNEIAVAEAIRPDPHILTLVNEIRSEIKESQRQQQLAKQLEHQNRQQTDRFLGGDVCARCHLPEHEAWAEGPHATAYESLVNLGMDASPECLTCHTVGFGESTGFTNAQVKPDLSGVQCESCHDMGSQHLMARDMTEKIGKDACITCHDKDNSPDFDFAGYMDKIRHWDD